MSANAAYNSDPTIWGPHVWATIHTTALKADSDGNDIAFSKLLESLTQLLPCDQCLTDFSKYFKIHGIPVKGHAFEWTVNLHNSVNRKLKYAELSLEDARSRWQGSNCSFLCTRKEEPSASWLYSWPALFSFQLVILLVLWNVGFRIKR